MKSSIFFIALFLVLIGYIGKMEGANQTGTSLKTSSAVGAIFINEIHYDNRGEDNDEFVEVAIANSFAGDITTIDVFLYDGSTGLIYDRKRLEEFEPELEPTDNLYTYYTWNPTSIQNGEADGIAIVQNLNLMIEFLSYEGTMVNFDEYGYGTISSSICAYETDDTFDGYSIQRFGSDWKGPMIATKGTRNISIEHCGDGVKNGDEIGVDCGGLDCVDCGGALCSDGMQNGDEEGIDCGGLYCEPCNTCYDLLYLQGISNKALYESDKGIYSDQLIEAGESLF